MAQVTLTVTGMEALQRAIVRVPDQVKNLSADAVSASTFAILQGMRANVPVRSGVLKSQMTAAISRSAASGRVNISPEAYYWKYVEYGRNGFKSGVSYAAQPFIRPAAEAESGHFEQRIRAIGQRLERDFAAGRFV